MNVSLKNALTNNIKKQYSKRKNLKENKLKTEKTWKTVSVQMVVITKIYELINQSKAQQNKNIKFIFKGC